MNIPLKIISQVMVIFLLMFIGAYLFRTKKLTATGTKQMSNILLLFVMPSVLINSMQIAFDWQMFIGLLWSFALAILTHTILIILTKFIILRKADDPYQIGVERCCAIMSNAGFFSLPIVQALWGVEGMFYATAYIAVYNILSWTYMVKELTHHVNGKLSLKSIVLNPGVIGAVVGFVCYVSNFTIPTPFGDVISFLAGANTPIAMIVIGAFIGAIDFKSLFTNKRVYYISSLRILILPLIIILIYKLIDIGSIVPNAEIIVLINAVLMISPVGLSVSLFAQRYDIDTQHCSKIIAISTLFSIFTMPILISIIEAIL